MLYIIIKKERSMFLKKSVWTAIFAGLIVIVFEYLPFENTVIKLSIQIPILVIGILSIYCFLGNSTKKDN